jgi:hypothetical protein
MSKDIINKNSESGADIAQYLLHPNSFIRRLLHPELANESANDPALQTDIIKNGVQEYFRLAQYTQQMQAERDVALARVAELEHNKEPTVTQTFAAGAQCLNVNFNVCPTLPPHAPLPAVSTFASLACRPAKPPKPPKYSDRCRRETTELTCYKGG